jgi:hypothetical protein
MDRRQLLKGLAALPLARLSYGYGPSTLCSGTCNLVPDSLLVWVEGPFAVVLNQDDEGDPIVTAFSPVDVDHLVNITASKSLQGAYPSQFHLSLEGDGVKPSTATCISSDFKDFCADHLGNILGDPENAFVRLQMPLPTNIYTSHRLSVTLANGTQACLPQDHIFEYTTVAEQPITLVYEDKKQSLGPISSSNLLFHIEVGLALDPMGHDSDPNGDHAKHFHNKAILAHFGLQNDTSKQITTINPCVTAICKRTMTPEGILKRLPGLAPRLACPRTTTLECKSGGLIGGSP